MSATETKKPETSAKAELFPDVLETEKKPFLEVDLDTLYARTFSELGLQQSKRDQIITLYLAMFSFLIPFALSMEGVGWQAKGSILLVAAIVGILFALIIIRYRIYKEVYWLSCQSLTVLHGIKPDALNKEMIQKVYYRTLKKKGKAFLKTRRDGTVHFSAARYIKKNLFSSESLYFFIHAFLTALIFGLSIGLIVPFSFAMRIAAGSISGCALFAILAAKYFKECIKVYRVVEDEADQSFNNTFSKAWMLHFYV